MASDEKTTGGSSVHRLNRERARKNINEFFGRFSQSAPSTAYNLEACTDYRPEYGYMRDLLYRLQRQITDKLPYHYATDHYTQFAKRRIVKKALLFIETYKQIQVIRSIVARRAP